MPPRKGKRGKAEKAKDNLNPPTKRQKTNDAVVVEGAETKEEGVLVLSLGMGDFGQLGLGEDVPSRTRPGIVTALEAEDIGSVKCGGMHSVATTKDGKVYSWGCNDEGALGRPTADAEDEFKVAIVSMANPVKVVQISAGDNHTAFMHENGAISCCGSFRDSKGMIGLTARGREEPKPIVLWNPSDEKCIGISSGNEHVAFVTDKGRLYTFGVGEQGQLGRIASYFADRGGRRGLSAILGPDLVHHQWGNISSVFCGGYHTFAVAESQQAYAWGLNNYGQLGVGNTKTLFKPKKVMDGMRFSAFGGGQHHSLALGRDGRVFASGRVEYGRLGLGENPEEAHSFVEVPGLQDVVHVASAGCVSFAVTREGKAHGWGMGTNMQLATGNDDDVMSPTVMSGKAINSRRILSISVGGQHLALLAEK
eukprot:m.34756 g.34756  ORF g.34756 m.34756 type:complete len:422 (+) comp32010_c0_seq1:90-1355(+)